MSVVRIEIKYDDGRLIEVSARTIDAAVALLPKDLRPDAPAPRRAAHRTLEEWAEIARSVDGPVTSRAMQSISGGSPQTVRGALRRLEKAGILRKTVVGTTSRDGHGPIAGEWEVVGR